MRFGPRSQQILPSERMIIDALRAALTMESSFREDGNRCASGRAHNKNPPVWRIFIVPFFPAFMQCVPLHNCRKSSKNIVCLLMQVHNGRLSDWHRHLY